MTDQLTQARAALREVVANLLPLLRKAENTRAIGTWTVGDVAAHLSHVCRLDTDALAGNPLPAVEVTTAGMSALNERLLSADAERNPVKLADRIAELATAFDEAAASTRATTVTWLQDAQLTPAAVACHLLEECLVHGHDIAAATGQPWPISRAHALLTIEGAAFALAEALPRAFVDQEKARNFTARVVVKLRGGARKTMVFDNGTLTVADCADNADAHLNADPVAMMLIFIGRQALWQPLLTGKLMAWGPRPWKLARMLLAISPP